jgi:RNA polymerase sigma-70 factor (ECF subfamily)
LKIAEGDEAAFREIFHQYAELVRKNLYSITKSAIVTDDLVQETFLRVWLHRDKLPDIEHFRSWVLHIAYNLGFTYLRNIKTHRKLIGQLQVAAPVSTQYEPEQATRFMILSGLVKQIIEKLPKRQKKIYLLSRDGGLKPGEIAVQLGLSESTVKNTLTRALKHIRDALSKAGYGLLLDTIISLSIFFY